MNQVVVIHYGFDFTLLTNSIECFFFHNKETKLPVQIFF